MSAIRVTPATDTPTADSILLVDEYRGHKYLIPRIVLSGFTVNASTWSQVDAGTATFDLSADRSPLAIPSLIQDGSVKLSMLARDPENGVAYFVSPEALEQFKIATDSFPRGVSVVRIRAGNAALAHVPPLQRALLQSSTY